MLGAAQDFDIGVAGQYLLETVHQRRQRIGILQPPVRHAPGIDHVARDLEILGQHPVGLDQRAQGRFVRLFGIEHHRFRAQIVGKGAQGLAQRHAAIAAVEKNAHHQGQNRIGSATRHEDRCVFERDERGVLLPRHAQHKRQNGSDADTQCAPPISGDQRRDETERRDQKSQRDGAAAAQRGEQRDKPRRQDGSREDGRLDGKPAGLIHDRRANRSGIGQYRYGKSEGGVEAKAHDSHADRNGDAVFDMQAEQGEAQSAGKRGGRHLDEN